ncbi:MAG: hypothetical protein ACM3NQ_13095 [Bacteroidales bacterium]
MRRLIRSKLLVIGLAASFWSCNNSIPTIPTNPADKTETFTGTLTPNGAQTFTFIAVLAGNVTATLTAVSPDVTTQIGLSLGTWNGSSCQEIITKVDAVQGNSVIGTAKASSNLCVRVYDAGAKLTAPESFTVRVQHP